VFELKLYQSRALDALRAFLANCLRHGDPDTAFVLTTKETVGRAQPYNAVRELPGLPYCCVRIPTGGGKTVVASHAVGIAAREFLRADRAAALWLAPSNTIREQTLRALRDRRHPYRQAVDRSLGEVEVLDVEEALRVSRAALDGATVIIVSTVQAFRVEDTTGRRVYEDSGHLMGHFSDLPSETLEDLERFENGEPLRSLSNVLRLRRPVVIVDEAHNARTSLSFATLARFAPSCILEFTATPNVDASDPENPPSNIICTVSAAELASDAMVKLPIILEARPSWKELVVDAVRVRDGLEEACRKELRETEEYIRPIMLLQAQPEWKDRPSVTVDVLRSFLLEERKIPEEQVKVATGARDEIEGVNLASPECPVRYIITVQKLKEGWDCPFAYVLCTVAELGSRTAVEQILGRIMRLPQAKRKHQDDLNHAYAFAASARFAEAAEALTEALVQNGFERQEAADLIVRADGPDQDDMFGGTMFETVRAPSVRVADFRLDTPLSQAARRVVTVDEATKTLTALAPIPDPVREELEDHCGTQASKDAVRRMVLESRAGRAIRQSASERRERFDVPLLLVKQGDIFEVFEETHLSEVPWFLRECNAEMAGSEFSLSQPDGARGEITVTPQGQVKWAYLPDLQRHLARLAAREDWDMTRLVSWLAKNIAAHDVEPEDKAIFLTSLVLYLTDARGIPLSDLGLHCYRLRDAVENKIKAHRISARARAFQTFLSPDCMTPLVVSPDTCFSYGPYDYPYHFRYNGPHPFPKHYYPVVGNLKNDGEEFECASFLDSMEEVDFWVRNIERNWDKSFWLQTATDKFYPDFVCKLRDGRVLVVEYKNEKDWTNADSREKRTLGELWAERSAGRCLFLMPKGKDFSEIVERIRSGHV